LGTHFRETPVSRKVQKRLEKRETNSVARFARCLSAPQKSQRKSQSGDARRTPKRIPQLLKKQEIAW
jgi:hypothetical protein